MMASASCPQEPPCRPILFSGPMVRALLDGRKTQTRRVLKPQPNLLNGGLPLNDGRGSYSTERGWKRYPIARGDRLWVRESWDLLPLDEPKPEGSGMAEIVYWADAERREFEVPAGFDPMIYGHERFRPSIHMPRWASRLTLTVTDVRVQQLQQISAYDSYEEGVPRPDVTRCLGSEVTIRDNARSAYRAIWEAINGPGSWAENPWVVAYTFTVERQNIDEGRAELAPAPSTNEAPR